MGGLGPYKLVAAVVCWSNNHVVPGERLERALKNRSRQMRAVAVEGNDPFASTLCEVCKHRSQTCGEALSFLRNYARSIACQLRQLVYVRLRAHDGDFHIAQFQRPRQRQRVFQKTAIESRDSFSREAGSQASLDRTWPRCLRHDYQRAGLVKRRRSIFAGGFHSRLL